MPQIPKLSDGRKLGHLDAPRYALGHGANRFDSRAEGRRAQENPPSLTLAAPLPKSSTVAPKADRRNVERVGRVLGDGSRRGARTVRRLTVYLGASLGQRLELYSATTGDQKSDVVERAVAAYLDTLGA